MSSLLFQNLVGRAILSGVGSIAGAMGGMSGGMIEDRPDGNFFVFCFFVEFSEHLLMKINLHSLYFTYFAF